MNNCRSIWCSKTRNGQSVKLGDYFGKKPVVAIAGLLPVPMLCNQVLNGMVTAFKVMPSNQDRSFEVVTVSFDPRETAALAAAKRKYLCELPARSQARGEQPRWHFLTGERSEYQTTDGGGRFSLSFDEATISLCTPARFT